MFAEAEHGVVMKRERNPARMQISQPLRLTDTLYRNTRTPQLYVSFINYVVTSYCRHLRAAQKKQIIFYRRRGVTESYLTAKVGLQCMTSVTAVNV